MTRLEIKVGGETVYDHEALDWQLPPRPDLIGPAVRAQAEPNAKPPPFLKAFMVAALANAIEKAMRDPRLAPLDVDLQTRSTGWTMTVDIPAPVRTNDVEVGGS